jgi:hypothetical protein
LSDQAVGHCGLNLFDPFGRYLESAREFAFRSRTFQLCRQTDQGFRAFFRRHGNR